jgi:N-acetylated-alpha-linked acidic dipeptidase
MRMLTLVRLNGADAIAMRLPWRLRAAHVSAVCWLLVGGWLAATPTAGRAADLSSGCLLGFTAESSGKERALEERFDAGVNAGELREWLERMSAEPNQVGSPHDRANAEFMLGKFREWGWEAELETFYVLYPTPKKQVLELVAPNHFTARLVEPAVAGDKTSGETAEALPAYNAYGADGDVTAELVYVNYGMPEDYKELARHAVDVKGKIVITRYGGGWRGLKPKLAYEHGAIGCIIYSDPHEDGYAAGDVYPKGGFRPADGVQRGSVEDLAVEPGDPLTPGVGATKDARRVPLAEAKTVLKIPVLPISYGDAEPLLEALGGAVAPSGWRGSLPITYHIGPGPARVHLSIASDWEQKPIYDVIAKLKGSQRPDEWVIRGNHHDGWVFGAWDPLSANVALMAEAKAIGELAQSGWRPKRTLVYASWDGEEPGLLGSTEWVETHAEELRRKAVVYVNSDSNGRGFLDAGGSHSLEGLLNEVAAQIRDPETGTNALARMRAKLLVEASGESTKASARETARRVEAGEAPPLEALGSGSDYTPFMQHLGIASLAIGYGGEDKSAGIYHSTYDSFDHYARFGDPGFAYGVVLARTVGHITLRVADADVVPFRFQPFSRAVEQYANEVHKLAEDMRERTERQHRLLDQDAFELAADPSEPHAPPVREASVPFLNFAPLDNAVLRLKRTAKACDEGLEKLSAPGCEVNDAQAGALDALLQGMEQALTYEQGLPGREWFRHMIYAPGLQTGYGVKTLPGVREGIEERQWDKVEQYMKVIASALNAYSDRLEKVTALSASIVAVRQS